MLEALRTAVIDGDEQAAPGLCRELLARGMSARSLLDEGLMIGMAEVGRRFREGEYFIPEVLTAAEAMKAAMVVLKPGLAGADGPPRAKAVVGTVQGDLHDIGKSLLSIMLEGAGFEVVDLGIDVPAERFVEACRTHAPRVVGLSALLTTTMMQMGDVIARIRSEVADPPRIIVGGAPVTQQFADRIQADGYGRDAASGAELARRLCGMGERETA